MRSPPSSAKRDRPTPFTQSDRPIFFPQLRRDLLSFSHQERSPPSLAKRDRSFSFTQSQRDR
ncbi:MAG: hypothetical protein AB4042_01430 [Leptolyngbyaceae cyanobacterium]